MSNGAANGRQVWEGPHGGLFHFSDGGSKIAVSDKAKIKYDDLIIKLDN